MPLKIIAEIGSVHDGSFGNAKKLIELSSNVGADIVKFQTHLSEFETSKDAPNPPYFSDENRFEYFERTAFDKKQYSQLFQHSTLNGIDFLSSPFSIEAVDFLEKINVTSYKVPSGEVTNLALLERLADTKKTIYLSSGMSNWKEIEQAMEVLHSDKTILMQCSSVYPCPPKKVGLNVIREMKDKFDVEVGFSDHTDSFYAGIMAIGFGATVIEKHLTFSKKMYGSDALNAMEPEDFKNFTKELRDAFQAMEHPVDKDNLEDYIEMKKIFEKSIYLKKDIKKGEKITLDHLSFLKPGDGISSSKYKEIIGRVTKRNLKKGSQLNESEIK